jgi:hypothetical protein
MIDEAEIPQQAVDDAGGCLRYGAGFVIGVLSALGTSYTWHRAMLASPGGDREGGGGMFLTFIVFPLLVIVLGPAGIVIARITRKPGKHRWVLWTRSRYSSRIHLALSQPTLGRSGSAITAKETIAP